MRVIAVGALLLLGSVSAAAQSPAQRAQLAAWDDSLAAATSLADLGQFERAAGEGDNALRQLRRAFLNTRRGELGHDRGAFEKALFDFDQASARHRSWAWPEYGSTKVFKALHFGGYIPVGSIGQFDGESHADALWRHLRSALQRDPTMPGARAIAVDLLTRAGDRILPALQHEVLDGLVRSPNPEPNVLLVLGRDARGRVRYDSALALFERSLRAGGDASRLALERARTLRALGDTANAAAAYWSGLRTLTAAGRDAYRTDLAWIVSPDSLATFDALTPDSILPWFQRFWGLRDMRSARTTDGRLLEHLRRWSVAFANFRVTLPWRRTMFRRIEFGFEGRDACIASIPGFYERLARMPPLDSLDLRAREPLLDHRGLIYLRHGDPIGRQGLATATGASGPRDVGIATGELAFEITPSQSAKSDLKDSQGGTEVWLYFLEGDWRILFFRGSKALGNGAGTTLTSYMPIEYLREWWAAAQLLPRYGPAADKLSYYTGMQPKTCLPEVTQAIATSRAGAVAGIYSDSDSPPLTSPWNAALNIFAIGSDRDENGRALITFALPTRQLTGIKRADGRFAFEVRFRISAFEQGGGRMIQLDTARHFSSESAPAAGQYLSGLFELPLTAGRWDISVLAQQGDENAGAFAEIRNRNVSSGSRLALSDVVTGVATGRPVWGAGDAPFPLNVLGVWTPRAPVEVYYEVYGLPTGAEYRSTLEVRPADGKKGKSITISSTEQSRGLTTPIRRTVGVAQLPAGAYRLIVSITRGTETVVSERPIFIVK